MIDANRFRSAPDHSGPTVSADASHRFIVTATAVLGYLEHVGGILDLGRLRADILRDTKKNVGPRWPTVAPHVIAHRPASSLGGLVVMS